MKSTAPLAGDFKSVAKWLKQVGAKREDGMKHWAEKAKKAGIKLSPIAWGRALPKPLNGAVPPAKAGTATRRQPPKPPRAAAITRRQRLDISINGQTVTETARDYRAAANDLRRRADRLDKAAKAMEAVSS